jgi:endoglucanase
MHPRWIVVLAGSLAGLALAGTAFAAAAFVVHQVTDPDALGRTDGSIRPAALPTGRARTGSTPIAAEPARDLTGIDRTARSGRSRRASTPLAVNGRLRVCGVHLCNEAGSPVQLRGMSTHGLQWFSKCYGDASLTALARDWHADLLRVSLYVQEGGYESDPAGFTRQVNDLVARAQAHGLYSIVDFHTLDPGDPNRNLQNAKAFFADVAAANADRPGVIYEIANEPHGVSWARIKAYAQKVIPVIRRADPDAVVLVGTRGWSSLGVSEGADESEVVDDPVDAKNIMYTFHFYAASHHQRYRTVLSRAARELPLFVSEFGTVRADGAGRPDVASTTAWLDRLDSLKISYANWTWSDAPEGSAAFRAGTCDGSTFTGTGVLTPSGLLVRSRIRGRDPH